jgi:hypothetical protein
MLLGIGPGGSVGGGGGGGGPSGPKVKVMGGRVVVV